MPNDTLIPNNGVAITPRPDANAGTEHRTYEIYQRKRPGESTQKISPEQLTSVDQLRNPHEHLEVLREHYPCYRDWSGNAYWVTRYDDVTSIFSDRANFSVRTRAHECGLSNAQDLSASVSAHRVWADLIDNRLPQLCSELLDGLTATDSLDLSVDYALALSSELSRLALGLPSEHRAKTAKLFWHIQRADSWQPDVAREAQKAISQLTGLLKTTGADPDYPGLRQELPAATDSDLIATVLGFEARTLHGWIANLSCAWLANPDIEAYVRTGRAELKIAALEAMRHSPPAPYAHVRARHEVERFGQLLPEGALLRLSAEAANRDPRAFTNPNEFIAGRNDICHREARGQFRADGLATGIAFGLGLPSKHPALPEDRPRSLYALTRDATVMATELLLERYPKISPQRPISPPQALAMFEPMIAWSLPARLA